MIRLTAAVLVLLLLCGCAPSGYKLMQENGSYYIQFSDTDKADLPTEDDYPDYMTVYVALSIWYMLFFVGL